MAASREKVVQMIESHRNFIRRQQMTQRCLAGRLRSTVFIVYVVRSVSHELVGGRNVQVGDKMIMSRGKY